MKTKIIIALALALIALIFLNIKTCGKLTDVDNINSAKSDTIRTQKNEKGQYESTIAIMQGTVADFKKIEAGKDSTIAHLQSIVDKHTISATVHGTVTGNSINSGTAITKYDTITKNDTTYLYPTYATKFKNRWEDFSITANKDSFHLDYKVFNEFDYVVRYNRPKWYKARVPEITVTNLNTHTQTIELKNFTVKPPKNQKILVFLGGCIVGAASSIGTAYAVKTLIQ